MSTEELHASTVVAPGEGDAHHAERQVLAPRQHGARERHDLGEPLSKLPSGLEVMTVVVVTVLVCGFALLVAARVVG